MSQTDKNGGAVPCVEPPLNSVSPLKNKTVSSPLIDAELANIALRIRKMGRQFENYGGQTAEEFLEALGI